MQLPYLQWSLKLKKQPFTVLQQFTVMQCFHNQLKSADSDVEKNTFGSIMQHFTLLMCCISVQSQYEKLLFFMSELTDSH